MSFSAVQHSVIELVRAVAVEAIRLSGEGQEPLEAAENAMKALRFGSGTPRATTPAAPAIRAKGGESPAPPPIPDAGDAPLPSEVRVAKRSPPETKTTSYENAERAAIDEAFGTPKPSAAGVLTVDEAIEIARSDFATNTRCLRLFNRGEAKDTVCGEPIKAGAPDAVSAMEASCDKCAKKYKNANPLIKKFTAAMKKAPPRPVRKPPSGRSLAPTEASRAPSVPAPGAPILAETPKPKAESLTGKRYLHPHVEPKRRAETISAEVYGEFDPGMDTTRVEVPPFFHPMPDHPDINVYEYRGPRSNDLYTVLMHYEPGIGWICAGKVGKLRRQWMNFNVEKFADAEKDSGTREWSVALRTDPLDGTEPEAYALVALGFKRFRTKLMEHAEISEVIGMDGKLVSPEKSGLARDEIPKGFTVNISDGDPPCSEPRAYRHTEAAPWKQEQRRRAGVFE